VVRVRFRLPKSKQGKVIALLLVGAFLFVLPKEWTGPLSALTQVLAPAQDVVNGLAHAAGAGADSALRAPVPYDQFSDLQRREDALQNQVAVLIRQLEDAKHVNTQLTGYAQKGLPADRLVPARVVSVDPATWRDTRMVNRGATKDVRKGDLVLSRCMVSPMVDADVPDGAAVLFGEVLLGHVEVANPFNSRLVLVSDPANKPRRVQVAALRDGKTIPLDAQFLLRGLGRYDMQLYEVHHQYIDKGEIRIGDLVMTSPSSGPVEIPLNIGVITEIQKNIEQPLLYECTVESKVDLEKVRQVYLVVGSGGGQGRG
jgi:cell shape-determining protein MreC